MTEADDGRARVSSATLAAASLSSRHASATCRRSVRMLPTASRSTYRPPSFVCDRNARPLALMADSIRPFVASHSASPTPLGRAALALDELVMRLSKLCAAGAYAVTP